MAMTSDPQEACDILMGGIPDAVNVIMEACPITADEVIKEVGFPFTFCLDHKGFRPMVYAMFLGDRLMYIGASSVGLSRPFSPKHEAFDGEKPKAFWRVICWTFFSAENAFDVEMELIRRFKPPLNVNGKRNS